MYTAVEKGNLSIIKLILSANPDLEIATKVKRKCVVFDMCLSLAVGLVCLLVLD